MQKKGISLIVLVITIIVMIILAASVIIAMSNNGIIDRANQAVKLTDEKQVQDLAALIWAETYLDPEKKADIENVVKTELEKQGITETDWNIQVSDTGVVIKSKNNSSGNDTVVDDGKVSVKIFNSIYNTDGRQTHTVVIDGVEYTTTTEVRVEPGTKIACTTSGLGGDSYMDHNQINVLEGKGTYEFNANTDVNILFTHATGGASMEIVDIAGNAITALAETGTGESLILAVENMTWAEYCNSANNGMFSVEGNTIVMYSDTPFKYNGVNIKPTDKIINGAYYTYYEY